MVVTRDTNGPTVDEGPNGICDRMSACIQWERPCGVSSTCTKSGKYRSSGKYCRYIRNVKCA